MNKLFSRIELNNGVVVEFFSRGNRYYGDFHRVVIVAVVTVPFDRGTLAEDLQEFAAGYPESIQYEKKLERMGVTTSDIEVVTQVLIDDFIETVGHYLEMQKFAERWLRREMQNRNKRNSRH